MTGSKPKFENGLVRFATGELSLAQIEAIFNVLPFDVDFINRDNRFTWFSNRDQREHKRQVSDLNKTLQEIHPAPVAKRAQAVISSFRVGLKDHVEIPLNLNGHLVDINYYAVRDAKGEYLGAIEVTGSIDHIKSLLDKGVWESDATAGASEAKTDTTTSASQRGETASGQTDTTTGASERSMDDDRWLS